MARWVYPKRNPFERSSRMGSILHFVWESKILEMKMNSEDPKRSVKEALLLGVAGQHIWARTQVMTITLTWLGYLGSWDMEWRHGEVHICAYRNLATACHSRIYAAVVSDDFLRLLIFQCSSQCALRTLQTFIDERLMPQCNLKTAAHCSDKDRRRQRWECLRVRFAKQFLSHVEPRNIPKINPAGQFYNQASVVPILYQKMHLQNLSYNSRAFRISTLSTSTR